LQQAECIGVPKAGKTSAVLKGKAKVKREVLLALSMLLLLTTDNIFRSSGNKKKANV
jgi:hypothetical protein